MKKIVLVFLVILLSGCSVHAPDEFPVNLLDDQSNRYSFEVWDEEINLLINQNKTIQSNSFSIEKDREIMFGIIEIDRINQFEREKVVACTLKEWMESDKFSEILKEEGTYLILININEKIGYSFIEVCR